jgi:hypothetical protein
MRLFFFRIKIGTQLVSGYLASDGALERDHEIRWNALIAMNALPDTWLTRVTAAG